MFQFLYTADFDHDFSSDEMTEDVFLIVKIYVLAGKYALDELKDLALLRFTTEALNRDVRGENGNIFAAIVKWTYENTEKHDQARKVVVLATIVHMKHLLGNDDEEFSKMMEELGEYGRDVAKAMRFSHHDYWHKRNISRAIDVLQSDAYMIPYDCDSCGRHWKLDVRRIPLGVEEVSVACMICRGVMGKSADRGFSLLYEWECIGCKLSCECSDGKSVGDWRLGDWRCCYCHDEYGFELIGKVQ